MSKPRKEITIGKIPWFRRKSTLDLLGAFFGPIGLLIAYGTAKLTAELAKTWLPPALLAMFVLNMVVVGGVWYWNRGQEDEETSSGWIVSACRIIELGIAQVYGLQHGMIADVCVAAYVPERGNLVQIVEMGGDGEFIKRTIPDGKGAVGMAAKRRGPVVGQRKNPDLAAFRAQLRSEYQLPPAIIGTVRENMWSWLAVPILSYDRKRLLLVVFIDSDRADCFKVTDLAVPGNPTGISAVAMRLCSGIADHFVEYQ